MIHLALYATIAGLLLGVYFALLGLSVTLIFGVMRIVNLTHGALVVFGGYMAMVLLERLQINPIVGMPLVFIAFVIFGLIIYYPIVAPISRSYDPEFISLVVFYGVMEVLDSIGRLAFGTTHYSLKRDIITDAVLPVWGMPLPVLWLYVGGISLFIILLFFLYLYKSETGYATRAIMSNRDEARSVGINVERISALNFGVGMGLAAIPGCLLSYIYGPISVDSSLTLTIIAFVVVIIGTLGSPLGVLLGGLISGVALGVTQVFAPSFASVIGDALLLIVLLIRPQGLFGRLQRNA